MGTAHPPVARRRMAGPCRMPGSRPRMPQTLSVRRECLKRYRSGPNRAASLRDIARLLELASRLGRLSTGADSVGALSPYEDGALMLEVDAILERVFTQPPDRSSRGDETQSSGRDAAVAGSPDCSGSPSAHGVNPSPNGSSAGRDAAPPASASLLPGGEGQDEGQTGTRPSPV
jgi:hypothetical protein